MKKVVLELILDGLNQLEEGSPTAIQEFILNKSDINYIKSHLVNYNLDVEGSNDVYRLIISKKESK